MKYQIYKLINPRILREDDDSGYEHKYINRTVLEEISDYSINDTHNSIEACIEEIKLNSEKLKNSTLTIIPIIGLNYFGDIIE